MDTNNYNEAQLRYADAQSRYQGYRDAAYAIAWGNLKDAVPSGVDLRLMPIEANALSYWSAIRDIGHVNEAGNFQWDQIFQQVRRTPRRFDIAIWDGGRLCGMACGMASRGHQHLTVKWLERFRTDSGPGLRGMVAEIALTAADHYAAILGQENVRIKDPLPGTEHLYSALGFDTETRDKGRRYLSRRSHL